MGEAHYWLLADFGTHVASRWGQSSQAQQKILKYINYPSTSIDVDVRYANLGLNLLAVLEIYILARLKLDSWQTPALLIKVAIEPCSQSLVWDTRAEVEISKL
jgi:hypothetical protein